MSVNFSISQKGQVMTAPISSGSALYVAFAGYPLPCNDVLVYNPGPVAVYAVATKLVSTGPDVAEQNADTNSMIIPAGEKAVYRKKDIDTGLSLLSAGAAQTLNVYIGNGQ
jgi:hypothetical protein